MMGLPALRHVACRVRSATCHVTYREQAKAQPHVLRLSRVSRVPPSPFSVVRRSIFIQTERTPNPNSLKFLPGRQVLPESHGSGAYFTRNDKSHTRSPLAVKILSETDDITGVFIGRDFITLTKVSDASFEHVKPVAFGAIMDFFAEGAPVMLNEAPVSDTTILDSDSEVVAMIKELLEDSIRPTVQDDGGDIFYRGFDPETGVVKLQMAGACSGCPSSSQTLKSGVENMLKHYIPEVTSVEQVEDSALQELNKREADSLADRLAKAGIPFAD